MRPCIVVPHYCHERQAAGMLEKLARLDMTIILVDDGSPPARFAELSRVAGRFPQVRLQRCPANEGKGAAVMRGLAIARDLGFTHAVQVDADGQHAVDDIPALLGLARLHPDAIVSGCPVFDASAPPARQYGRKISLFWARVETWSSDIEDPMCGFRVYPVDTSLTLGSNPPIGAGMEFDVEILVRAHWAGIPLKFMPTRVVYPIGGTSHFRVFRDNLRISMTHSRLFFGMLRRSPRLLERLIRGRA